MTNYHVLPRKKGWAIKKEGSVRASKLMKTQDQATRYANVLGKNVFVHGRDGLIRKVKSEKINEKPSLGRIKSKRRVHVIPKGEKWAVRTEKSAMPNKIFSSKYKAIRHAHSIAANRGSSLVVHKSNGEINHIDIPPHFQSPMADLIHMR